MGILPNEDLARIVKLSSGSEIAQRCVKGLRCSICREAGSAKSPTPGKPQNNMGRFNEIVMADVGFECDVDGLKHAYLILIDEGTDWTVCKYLGTGQQTMTAAQFYTAVEYGWINWAGSPDVFVADNERG